MYTLTVEPALNYKFQLTGRRGPGRFQEIFLSSL